MMPSVSVVIPCLNESATLHACISSAKQALQQAGIHQYEIIVADNGSSDGSQQIAVVNGARLIQESITGYGAALNAGILAAQFEWIVFADADLSYNFADLIHFIPVMHSGAGFIIGNRFAGSIEKGAMPFLHRYVGTPVISFIGRRSFHVAISDFNCGMRAIKKDVYLQLQMRSTGMEFASEMIARASLCKVPIAEVPINLYKDGRGRKPHLKTWSDGWKHLRLILLLSPKWMLLYPATAFLVAGFLLATLLLFSYVKVFNLVLDIHTLYYASIALLVGMQLLQFYIIARLFAAQSGLENNYTFSTLIQQKFTFEKALISGGALLLAGILLTAYALRLWQLTGFGPLDPVSIFRIVIPAGFCIAAGMQVIVFGFLLYTMSQLLKTK